ncbi:peroxisomal membrane protein Pex22 [Schizosaccharomyces japonicus yFS275]|uniref:Peroxisomal membrane protein Pex22 n=1 Tax=Schizosaccharomyces japonicus (strain yFS275 / FY16936) TaxID=402676 RepID=B6JZG1_SCHJY|nr:peroxisomal membrane protein Pex22 [Schizosaccharomyces japonicus yFS275]EEB06929.2 peroxisomal membrane protein Pex22 [Schizosaccharomyces japonicus yFS275]
MMQMNFPFLLLVLAGLTSATTVTISCQENKGAVFPYGTASLEEKSFQYTSDFRATDALSKGNDVRCGMYDYDKKVWAAGTGYIRPKVAKDEGLNQESILLYVEDVNDEQGNTPEVVQATYGITKNEQVKDKSTPIVKVKNIPHGPLPNLQYAQPLNYISTKGSKQKRAPVRSKSAVANKRKAVEKKQPNKNQQPATEDIDEDEEEEEVEEKTFFQKYGLFIIPIVVLLFINGGQSTQTQGNAAR